MTLAKSSVKVESLPRVRRRDAWKFNTPMIDPPGYDAGKKIKGKKRRVSRTHRLAKEVWCYARNEGRPLEVGGQVQASNRCKLRASRATVVSVVEKPGPATCRS